MEIAPCGFDECIHFFLLVNKFSFSPVDITGLGYTAGHGWGLVFFYI